MSNQHLSPNFIQFGGLVRLADKVKLEFEILETISFLIIGF